MFISERTILWVLLFTGVIVHMLNYSCINIAITEMMKVKTASANKTYVAVCLARQGNQSTVQTEAKKAESKPVSEYILLLRDS
mgnify:CR=1 FL=1